jgi:GMP synthase (glutamine-hydrolysing)
VYVPGSGAFDTVLVVDFGAQYAQLIARRVRECHVYSEIVPSTMPVSEMLAKEPKAIILSGGPSSVYAPGAPAAPAGLFDAGIPVFGICYGHQVMVASLGGIVERTGAAEYGGTPVMVAGEGGRLLTGLPEQFSVWMSHGDTSTVAPVRGAVPPRGDAHRVRHQDLAPLPGGGGLPAELDDGEHRRGAD